MSFTENSEFRNLKTADFKTNNFIDFNAKI